MPVTRVAQVAGAAQNQFLRVQPDVIAAKCSGLLVFWLMSSLATSGSAQTSGAPEASTVAAPLPAAETWSIARIRDALARERVLVIRQPTFRTGITERRPSSFDLTEDTKRVGEPPIWNGGWHNEFVSMVTPPEYRTWQAFTNTDLLQLSATGLAAALAGKALVGVNDWRQAAREAAARDEVDRALAEFLSTRAGATRAIVLHR
jgi:hypothetical protein